MPRDRIQWGESRGLKLAVEMETGHRGGLSLKQGPVCEQEGRGWGGAAAEGRSEVTQGSKGGRRGVGEAAARHSRNGLWSRQCEGHRRGRMKEQEMRTGAASVDGGLERLGSCRDREEGMKGDGGAFLVLF